jgi:polyferredoxin
MATMVPEPTDVRATRKKLTRRAAPDRSQRLRHLFQLTFLVLNAWIGAQFYFFVRYYETAGKSFEATRPPGVEGWLPVASLMDLKVLLLTGEVPRVHPAGLVLLLAFIGMSWLARKSFCGWLCPVGTVSEALWRLGNQTFGRNFRLPRKLDIGLRGLKYILLGLFLLAVCSMSVEGIRAFLGGPYGLVDDVRMLNLFRLLGLAGGIVLAVLVIASVFVQNAWCRYLCPYGALMGVTAMASPLRIRRDTSICLDCDKCTKACPASLPVARLITIRSAECTSCLQCVAACPAAGALAMAAPGRRRVPAWAIAVASASIFLGSYGYARWSGHWQTDIPRQVYFDLIPHANEFAHP